MNIRIRKYLNLGHNLTVMTRMILGALSRTSDGALQWRRPAWESLISSHQLFNLVRIIIIIISIIIIIIMIGTDHHHHLIIWFHLIWSFDQLFSLALVQTIIIICSFDHFIICRSFGADDDQHLRWARKDRAILYLCLYLQYSALSMVLERRCWWNSAKK